MQELRAGRRTAEEREIEGPLGLFADERLQSKSSSKEEKQSMNAEDIRQEHTEKEEEEDGAKARVKTISSITPSSPHPCIDFVDDDEHCPTSCQCVACACVRVHEPKRERARVGRERGKKTTTPMHAQASSIQRGSLNSSMKDDTTLYSCKD